LARKSGFECREPRKITARNFILALLALASQGSMALRRQAQLIGWLGHQCVSKQAVRKRAKKGLGFVQTVLQELIQKRFCDQKVPPPFRIFNRVLIADSTTVALPRALASLFPGARNQCSSARQAQLKIQCYYDLLAERIVHFTLASFRNNDQSASPHILSLCAANDLVLRDLGYFVLKVFRQLAQRGSFFISRLRLDVALFDSATEQSLELLDILCDTTLLDRHVLMGKTDKLPVRLVALKLPEQVAARRRRERKQNRDKRLVYNARTKFLLGYEIFVTNVAQEQLDSSQILSIYGLRWRIEILFKAFKQHLNLARVDSTAPYLLELLIYARLLLITLLVNFVYAPLRAYAYARLREPISILKLFEWFALMGPTFFLASQRQSNFMLKRWVQQIPKHCSYETRSRLDFISCFYSLS
jgi:hypothetical protein